MTDRNGLQSRRAAAVSWSMQARRIEASVMTSLHELRAIEHERIADEHKAIEEARAAERAARELADNQRADAAQAKQRAVREEQIRIEHARVAAEREAWLHINAVEAAERARHGAALDEQRLHQEIELRRQEVARKRPAWMLAVTAIAVAAGLALAWFAIDSAHQSQVAIDKKTRAEQTAFLARQDADKSRLELEQVQRDLQDLDAKLTAASHRLDIAVTRAEQERLQAEMRQMSKVRAALADQLEKKRLRDEANERRRGFDARECAKTALGCMGSPKTH